MNYVVVFLLGFIFSFIGSIPPGTLNVLVLKMGLEGRTAIAMRFALAVAIIEYPYAWIGVQFEYWLASSPVITENFQLITAIVMTVLGISSLRPGTSSSTMVKKFNESGFRRGIVLSLLNPMAIPYWMAFTAYMKAQHWIDLSTTGLLHLYVFGTSVGTMALLSLLVFFATRLAPVVEGNKWVKLAPGIMLLALGLYAWYNYFF